MNPKQLHLLSQVLGDYSLSISDLLDLSRTPAQTFIKAPAFHVLPPDWLLLCEGLFKQAFPPLPVECHLLLMRPVFHQHVCSVLGRRTPERLVWYLKHAPQETAVCRDCLQETWRFGDGKIKIKTDEVKRGELSPGVCLHVGVSDSLGRLIAFQG